VIFVTLGTLHFPFERLVRAVDSLPGEEEVVLQCRVTGHRPVRARHVRELPFDELVQSVRAARAVVCHAGVGSVLTALGNGRRPIVVPRLRRFGEAVDDHQLHFARRLAAAGVVVLVEEPSELAAALALEQQPPAPTAGGSALAADLRATLAELVAHSR